MKCPAFLFVLFALVLSLQTSPLRAADTEAKARGRILDSQGAVLAESSKEGQRSYPRGKTAGHLTGYLMVKNTKGAYGLEKSFNESLAKGEDLALTLDLRLQDLVREAFPRDKKGAVVVIDPNTGAVLAMNSFPEYDPNDFVPAISKEKWEAYINDPRHPMLTRTVHPYVPGSVYKIPAALAAGMAGLEDRSYPCEGGVNFGDVYLKCWISGKPPGKHGDLDLSEAVKHSCNAWFYQLANESGIEPFEKTARLLGLFDSTGCGLPNEKSGDPPSEYFKKKGLPFTSRDRAINTIGQGTVLATPMQLASMTATVANGGKRYQAHLVQEEKSSLLADLTQSGISADHIEVVRKAMWRAVNEPDAPASKLRSEDVAIAGKTGTAQTGRPDRPFHAWFIGFAPYENPRLAICVFVENGESGSRVAGPIAKNILTRGLSLLAE